MKLILFAIFLLSSCILYCQEIIDCKIINKYHDLSPESPVIVGKTNEYFYINGAIGNRRGAIELAIPTGEIKMIDIPNAKKSHVYIVLVQKENTIYFYNGVMMDIQTKMFRTYNEKEGKLLVDIAHSGGIYYQNGQFYGARSDQYNAHTQYVDIEKGVSINISKKYSSLGPFVGFSDDKMHLLDWSDGNVKILRMPGLNVVNKDLEIQGNRPYPIGPVGGFLNNEYIYSYNPEGNVIYIHALNGKKAGSVRILADGIQSNEIYFSKDLGRAFISIWPKPRAENNIYYALIDATPFRDWLDKQGYIWRVIEMPINTISNRIYKNANVNSEVIGKYIKETPIKIIDKSGGRDTINRSLGYWYKVSSSEGIEGWVFGKDMPINIK